MKIIIYIISLLSLTISFSQDADSIDEEIFTILDEPATFTGGYEMFKQFLVDELVYPETALEKGVEGHVFIQLIVEKNGSFSELLVVKGIGAGCDEEALRLIKKMPNWVPAKEKGNVVRQKMIQRIQFTLPATDKQKGR